METSLFSAFIHERMPNAALRLIDGSSAMLDQARQRLVDVDDVEFRVEDINVADLSGSSNLIVSAFAIHHLDDMKKQELFTRVRTALLPSGLFVNAEQVLGPTPAIQASYAKR